MSRPLLVTWRDAVVDSDLPASPKLVALALTTWMNSKGHCFPSQREIARRTSLTENTVRTATKALESAGLLAVSWSRGKGSHGYQAVIPNPATVEGIDASQPRKWPPPTPQMTPFNPATIAHESAESAESVADQVAAALRRRSLGQPDNPTTKRSRA